MSRTPDKWLNMRLFAVCLLLMLVFAPATAQKQELDQENIQRIQRRRGLYYDGKKPEPKKIQDEESSRSIGLSPEFEGSPLIEKIINAVLYSILALGLIYGLYQILTDYKWFRAPSKTVGPMLSAENIESIDIEALQAAFEQAVANEQPEQVVRLGYILCLKWLNEKRYLRWRRDKTNQAYLSELYGSPHYEHFRTATRLFNDCVYGKYPVGTGQSALMVASVESIQRSEVWQV